MEINKSRGTALHVAVNDGNEEVVKSLVNSILCHKNEKEALKCKNEKGDTPLHLAASRGFKDICECIIGECGERKDLIDIDNNNGESPLFLAALSWQKQTFVYLIKFKPGRSDCGGNYSYKDLIRNNGDSILHCTIQREFFDLAIIIIHKYPDLIVVQNKLGFSPVKLLATRPSAFKSGYKMIWWKKILYHCIPAGTLNVDEAIEYCQLKHEPKPQESCPKNYDTCYLLISFAKEMLQKKQTTYNAANGSKNMGKKDNWLTSECELLPENYATCLATCLWFLKFVYIYTLGLSGVGVEEIKKMKQKHKWSGQLFNIFMKNKIFQEFGLNPFESYVGSGAKPIGDVSGTDIVYANFNPNQGI
ncbi:putative non-specific serine/threonine protein kinase [Medicago truncatula]|uniref:Putative non-specific serine/threonine protein kinase n=1 Tax=Medicago truncatula TaxID=3880 RepID=A0A396IN50_MEDTR|nr:putative non-specific serine/threonine protein kinase [Medicago truncatula]